MALITIDHDKCKRDGICISECPFSLIRESKKTGFPEIRPAAERMCIHCGHCLAVCPHQALTFNGAGPEDCLPLEKKLAVEPEIIEQFIKSRRSIRTYKDKPVDHPTLERLLDTARWAPSAKNSQSVNWLMVEDPAEVKRLAGMVVDWFRENSYFPGVVKSWKDGRDMVLRGAPHVAIAHAAQGVNGLQKPKEDCAIAISYLELAAHAHGVGACWAGFLVNGANDYQPLVEALGLPPEHKVYGALMLGYPKFRYRRIPLREPAKVQWR